MASMKQIRDALAETIRSNVSFTVHTYETVEDMHHVPAVIIEPDTADYLEAFNMGMDTWVMNLWVLTSRSDPKTGQEQLDRLIDGRGPDSIREILQTHSDLGLEGTDVMPWRVKGYGGNFKDNGLPHVGALIQVKVITDSGLR